MLCLYFMGLNLSNEQIARELSVHSSDVQKMATQLRSGVVERKPLVTLYRHQTGNHGRGEYARDDDHDGFCEVHVNTIEGFWSRIRSWLRPHRGLSQECLPLYLGFFEFVYNARRRGAALLESLVGVLVAPRIAG